MTKPSIPIEYYKGWAAPTVLALLLVSPSGSELPERYASMDGVTGRVEYFNPKNNVYTRNEQQDVGADQIFCQFAHKIIENSETISPDLYQILLDNRKSLLL